MARPYVWPDAALRPQPLDLPLLRPGGAPDVVDVGGVPAPAAGHGALRHPLRHALVEARQRLGGCLRALHRRAGEAAAGGEVRAAARGPRLHDQHGGRRSPRRRRRAGGAAQREGPRARPRRADAPGAAEALFLEVEQVAARLRVPGGEPAGLLGAERLSHERRPVDGGALLRSGDARDAADARGGRPQAAGKVMAVRVERVGAVTTIVLDRPEARNAVGARSRTGAARLRQAGGEGGGAGAGRRRGAGGGGGAGGRGGGGAAGGAPAVARQERPGRAEGKGAFGRRRRRETRRRGGGP